MTTRSNAGGTDGGVEGTPASHDKNGIVGENSDTIARGLATPEGNGVSAPPGAKDGDGVQGITNSEQCNIGVEGVIGAWGQGQGTPWAGATVRGRAVFDNPDKPKAEYAEFVSFPAAQLDYQVTHDLVKMLTDIRFRLLTILPPIAAASVALVSSQTVGLSPFSMFAVGLLGFFLTLGIILYDLRNSDLYNACVHRAKILEGVMRFVRSGKEGIKPTSPLEEPALLRTVAAIGKTMRNVPVTAPIDRTVPPVAWPGGPHTQRARRYLRFLGLFEVAHGSALALIYGTLDFPNCKGLLSLRRILLVGIEAYELTKWPHYIAAGTLASGRRGLCLPALFRCNGYREHRDRALQ
jgi:hypothetical protein